MGSPNRIDVHHHFVPPKFAEALDRYGNTEWPNPKWSISASQSLFQDRGINTAILSVTTPGVDVASDLQDQLNIARDANDTGASARDENPSQFGFFATIPNPVKFPSEAIAELTRALDDLHADGVTLMTSYSGKYLGNSVFDPLWSELNRRKAIVFIHPTSPQVYEQVSKTLLPPALDFTFETTKTACDIVQSGTFSRHPDVKIILSHGGGTLPWSWHRVAMLPKSMSMSDMTFETFEDQARSFYFDTALTGSGDNVDLLMKFAKPGHVLFGSDFPYAPNDCIADMTAGSDAALKKIGEDVWEGVNWRNAVELLPRLKRART